jgi:signal transduction histidine kinase
MNIHIQQILTTILQIEAISDEQKTFFRKLLSDADKDLTILEFKLDRTEKVKRTTAILLEETIEELEQKRKAIEESNSALKLSLEELKATQNQLVQQEKLASLGQLTAGIAHEIKNPLNFVNNFSEVTIELIEEVLEELKKKSGRDETLILEIIEDIRSNLQKVFEHGTRANTIVNSMLQHSREGTGKKEPTDLNALLKEYINLCFHGMRAGKGPINVKIIFDLDPTLSSVHLIKEDFSRVVINICNNSFDALRASGKQQESILRVSTKKAEDGIIVEIEDNGIGIPKDIKEKILQPFFTTKKGNEGTGLGLSITHDIIKAHGGELNFESTPGEGTKFLIRLPFI